MTAMIHVELAWMENNTTARLLAIKMPQGSSVACLLKEVFPNESMSPKLLSIFSQPCQLDAVLQEGCRLEITRPLLIDPKQARHLRAKNALEV